MERRKLFSSSKDVSSSRRKLFSNLNEGGASNNMFNDGEAAKRVQCRDCGYVLVTSASTTSLRCPKCGSVNRFNIFSISPSPDNSPEAVEVEVSKIEEVKKEPKETEEKVFSRRSLFEDSFQKEFSESSNEFEENLKKFSGKELSDKDVEKFFSCKSDELLDKGFAKVVDDTNIRINDNAFLQSKLFSKLIVSVTKVLDLDPKVTLDNCNKEEIINSLEERDVLPPKGIILIKKAHSLPIIEKESEFSIKNEELESWIEDSGIIGDLKLEFGGSKMSVKEFTDLLNERYNDAPDNLIDNLIEKGVIKIQGNQVDILK